MDNWMVLAMILFPFLVGGPVLLLAALGHRAATVDCPSCGKRIPKTALSIEGLRCHHCEWRVEAQVGKGSSMVRPAE